MRQYFLSVKHVCGSVSVRLCVCVAAELNVWICLKEIQSMYFGVFKVHICVLVSDI